MLTSVDQLEKLRKEGSAYTDPRKGPPLSQSTDRSRLVETLPKSPVSIFARDRRLSLPGCQCPELDSLRNTLKSRTIQWQRVGAQPSRIRKPTEPQGYEWRIFWRSNRCKSGRRPELRMGQSMQGPI